MIILIFNKGSLDFHYELDTVDYVLALSSSQEFAKWNFYSIGFVFYG
jgi:hypothetical protein